MTLKFLQVNMNRCRAAHDLLFKTVQEKNVNIILGQEPNKSLCNRFICDTNCDSFIYINRADAVISTRKGSGYVFVELASFCVCSFYFSPNGDAASFEELLSNVNAVAGSYQKETLFGGDLNAKTPMIGSRSTNGRGNILEEWLCSNNLVVLNQGEVPTFVRRDQKSIIDFTCAPVTLAHKIRDWRVESDLENLSDHQTISFQISETRTKPEAIRRDARWRYSPQQLERFSEACNNMYDQLKIVDPEELLKQIKVKCDTYLKQTPAGQNRRPVYWWNEEISRKRKICIHNRRTLTRARSRAQPGEDLEHLHTQHMNSKRELKKEIKKSKEEKWKKLCDDLNENVWGQAYNIALRRLKIQNNNHVSKETVSEVIKQLFPVSRLLEWKTSIVDKESVPIFEMDELKMALSQSKTKKAPGPDGITTELFRAAMKGNMVTLLKTINKCLIDGIFPNIWKKSKLVLIEKPKKTPSMPVTYRPICLIDEAGKLFERLLKNRIVSELETRRGISDYQFGFRTGKSTIDAIKCVKSFVNAIKLKAYKNRECCVMILVDVENAFNSAPWQKIIEALERVGISEYLLNVVKSYLSSRYIITEHNEIRAVTCGVPQGSVLGPVLWNVFYNAVLNLDIETGVKLVAYADDLAIMVKEKDRNRLEDKCSYAIYRVLTKLKEIGLKVAVKKTEVMLMLSKRTINEINVHIEDAILPSKTEVKYLGVTLNKGLSMTTHIKRSTERALKVLSAMSRIMPRVGGPRSAKRRLLANVALSTLLYAAPVWNEAIQYKKYEHLLEKVTRKMALLITAAYRTAPTTAILVLADVPPVALTLKNRVSTFAQSADVKHRANHELLQSWQAIWNTYEGWTKVFIKDLEQWRHRKSDKGVNYYTTQAMTGHGVFSTYLFRIGRLETDVCWYCAETDTPQHTIFQCSKFANIRRAAEIKCGTHISNENISSLMVKNESTQDAIMEMLEEIMREKCKEEKRRTK